MTNNERLFYLELLRVRKELAILNNNKEEAGEINITMEAVEKGYTEFYEPEPSELPREKGEEWTSFIYGILNLYSRMINSIQNKQKPPYTYTLGDVKFPGFDGNNELEEMKFVEFFIVRLCRFTEINYLNKGDYNSHTEMIPTYKRMLKRFKELGSPISLTNDEIREVLQA